MKKVPPNRSAVDASAGSNGDQIGARVRARIVRLAREQLELESRDRIAVRQSPVKAVLVGAIDRVGQVGLLPQRDVLPAIGPAC